ncbi:hypothetical protein GKG47_09035 [Lactonifactor sp. BIOML-A3]|uniref:hypothetical protein n=1 Tax=unclassified Lactonifactor TaxID=2636670 RepID=UPI0012B0468A|nr:MULTISPECIES: hypothetical protein [unclassified Lactonifactor]MSA02182.1 hypothetical protein [Lactonifactor sp. BIOML-A5]MSA07967.1 hypothetical protein [Lactonifactor sp. BIOML-A4]MSA12583.1 hypothetical protein [Lactonifactor sp. BIOML-A3]MSA16716.1 hypothetical protein [Lactonifactor sp. BIOML-A2]MSA37585.1 hypothetical protein [Lactonifactor sp. BIOML-A1]
MLKSINLNNLPRFIDTGNKGKINWKESVGHKVSFQYGDINDVLEIIGYNPERKSIIIKYKEKELKISCSHFKLCRIGKLCDIYNQYKYKIGESIITYTGKIEIIKQIRIKTRQYTIKGYLYKCLIDNNVDRISEYDLLNGTGCSVCSNHKVIKGINDIATTHPYAIKYFVNKEEAYLYSYGSAKRILFKCSECGFEKPITINKLIQRGFSCPRCGDGISYPEKFMFSVLNQLHINFEIQKRFEWNYKKQYDFYLIDYNCIIETHGGQHYSLVFGNYNVKNITLENEKLNDELKKEMAIKNGIEENYYIQLDCSISSLEWIKNSISNSIISTIFDLSNIDWLRCHEFACSSRVKEACSLWNEFQDMKTITELMKICRPTLIKYLDQGNRLEWCKYNQKENMRINGRNNGLSRGIPVEVFNNKNESLGVYKSASEVSRISLKKFGIKLSQTAISAVCRGEADSHKGFKFKII